MPVAGVALLIFWLVIADATVWLSWEGATALGYDGAAIWALLLSIFTWNCSTQNLLTVQDQLALRTLIGETSTFNLLFRGCRDGWSPSDFHDKVDGKGATVTLVRTKDGVFGGYTDISWASSGGAEAQGGDSFLFYKRDGEYVKLRYNRQDEVTHDDDYLAAFGGGPPDLAIRANCDENEDSYVRLNGVDYVYPPGTYSGRTANEEFTGGSSGWDRAYFKCVDMDVYKVSSASSYEYGG